jgi:MoxR-like ATPase
VVGVNVWNREVAEFEFRPGPVFASIVLGDEINRASPKTQSALLEAMAEAQVTVDGRTYQLERPFMVIATQNPIEHEGTYPLPESQLDRFLMRVSVGYPDRHSELDVLDTHGEGDALSGITPVVRAADIVAMAAAVRTVHVAPSLKGYLVDLAEASRRHPYLLLGMSPRATLALQRVARARAAAANRGYVIPDDIKALAQAVLAHRLIVTPEAQLQGVRAEDVLSEILDTVPVPTGAREV